MNFHEWYKFGTPEEQNCFMGDAEKGWEACKEEVLKIIHKEPNSVSVLLTNIIKEIEKL